METWPVREFAAAGLDMRFVQDNHSRSLKGTLRGLHYQLPQPQSMAESFTRLTESDLNDFTEFARQVHASMMRNA